MKCIILAAGISKRLRPLTNDIPKCLLKVGGVPLLKRTLESLLRLRLSDHIIVTGFQEKRLKRFVRRHFPRQKIAFIHNRNFRTTNNSFSLSLAQECYLERKRDKPGKPGPKNMIPSDPLLLLDSDILFRPNLIEFLINQRGVNKLAVRVRGHLDGEAMRVKIDRFSNILKIGKDIPLRESYGESIGIGLFSPKATAHLFSTLTDRIKSGNGRKEFYESSFQQLIDEGTKLRAIDISDFPVAEIDTLDDLESAERTIIPALDHA